MQFSANPSEEYSPTFTWQNIIDWGQIHYRDRIFRKDEQIPTRPQLIYLVNQGAVRLVSQSQNQPETPHLRYLETSELERPEESFLGFVGAEKPFEIVAQASFSINAYAHVDRTQVVWLYWQDLENWPDFRQQLYEAFRYQHQRKLLWLSALGQRKTIDRLISFLTLLIEEYGVNQGQNCCLPYSLTHAQIGSAIGSTRVTVTRLMGKLRRQGIISIKEDNSICVNYLDFPRIKQAQK
ncbi:MAG: Crp/Fnr family transcriptional regulator [Pleurocapsa sp.]